MRGTIDGLHPKTRDDYYLLLFRIRQHRLLRSLRCPTLKREGFVFARFARPNTVPPFLKFVEQRKIHIADNNLTGYDR